MVCGDDGMAAVSLQRDTLRRPSGDEVIQQQRWDISELVHVVGDWGRWLSC